LGVANIDDKGLDIEVWANPQKNGMVATWGAPQGWRSKKKKAELGTLLRGQRETRDGSKSLQQVTIGRGCEGE